MPKKTEISDKLDILLFRKYFLHFDYNYVINPENNNIKYTDDNKCKVFENNGWKEKDISLMSNRTLGH